MTERHALRPVRGIGRAAALSGLANLCGVALTATSGWLIVSASYRPIILTLLVAIVGVRTFGIARPLLRYAERLASHEVALRDLAERRADVYDRLVPLTPARLGRRRRSDLLGGVVRDLDDEVMAQIRVLVPVIGTLIASAVAVGVVAWLAPLAGLVVALGVVLAVLVAWLDLRLESRGQALGVEARAEVTRVAALVTGNAAELQAVGGEEDARRWLAAAHADVRRGAVGQALGRSVGTLLTQVVIAVSTVLTGVVAAHAFRAGELSGPLAALVTLTPLALGEAVATLPDALGSWARARAASARIARLLDQAPAVDGDPDDVGTPGELSTPGHSEEPAAVDAPAEAPAPLTISGRDLTASWTGARQDLAPVSLRVAPGEVLVVRGPNGGGKSTLLAVLARHLDPTGGHYRHDEQDATQLPLGLARSRIGILDDEPHILASTLRENLRLARPGADDAELTRALDAAGLGAWLTALPDDLDTMLGTDGRGISGGERTRLALARVILAGRPVWLLDEPLAHLDHATATAVLDDTLAAAKASRAGVIVVSHHAEALPDAVTLTIGGEA